MSRTRFTVPAADRIVNPSTDTDPSSVSRWIAQLPYADPARVTQAALQALSQLNRHPERVNARMDLMASFRIPCARLVRSQPGHANSPSAEGLRQLMVEMAYGYKHLANDILAQRSFLQNHKRLTHALYFAAKFLSLELFLAMEAYQCSSSNSWREILAMYRLAEEHTLQHEKVADTDQADPANATVSHVLKRILLLKLLDPCHMMHGEARACFDYFNSWASGPQLEPLAQAQTLAGRYLVDLDGLEAPKPPDPDTRPQNPERFRYFNLLPISRQAQQHLRQMELQGAAPPEGLQNLRDLDPALLLKRVLKAWHGRQERRSEREETFGWMLCGCGLGAVNHFISDELPNPAPPSAASETEEEVVDLGQFSSLSGRQGHYSRLRCRQVNRSMSGICIRLHLPSETDAQVGQVLMLEEDLPDGSGNWYAGIVRRRVRIDPDTLEAGIQFIRGLVKPIRIRLHGAQSEQFQPALWVDRSDSHLSSILTNRGFCRSGQELDLDADLGGPAALIKTEQLVESTPGFDRFRFHVIQP